MSVAAGIVLMVMFALIFGVAVPFFRDLGGTRHSDPGPRNPSFFNELPQNWGPQGQGQLSEPRDHWHPSARSGCTTLVVGAMIALAVLFILVVGWSILMQAGF